MRTSYLVLTGPRLIFDGGKRTKLRDITDGTSKTILVGECAQSVYWTAPLDDPFDLSVQVSGLGSSHPDAFNVAFADGSARTLKASIPSGTLGALITPNGGEVISGGY